MTKTKTNTKTKKSVFQIYCDRGNGPELDGCWGSEYARFNNEADANEAREHLAGVYDDCEWIIVEEEKTI
ncbi:MAG: hypothetical protein O2960_25875 [Verrucomicrobia bacterium]|nr:hypothetical protein [Verrucomicrobiota bacterium]